jgi:beta-lactam-binding protein with PASTA domain
MQRPVPGGMPHQQERRSSSWVMAVLAALGVLVVVVLGVAFALSRNQDKGNDNQQTATHAMPNLIGKTDAQAKQLLDTAGLRNVSPAAPKTDPSCDGKVDQQDPAANTQVREDATVSYRLCIPPDQVTVPDDLVGATKDSAQQRLTSLGLRPKFVTVSSDKQVDTVVDVEKQGEKVDPNTEITVKISNARRVKMPDVTNQQLEAAQAVLEQFGNFNVTTKTVIDPTKNPGTVVAQNPKAGTTVEKGSDVILSVVSDETPPSSPTPTDTGTPGGGGGTGGGQPVSDALAVIREDR